MRDVSTENTSWRRLLFHLLIHSSPLGEGPLPFPSQANSHPSIGPYKQKCYDKHHIIQAEKETATLARNARQEALDILDSLLNERISERRHPCMRTKLARIHKVHIIPRPCPDGSKIRYPQCGRTALQHWAGNSPKRKAAQVNHRGGWVALAAYTQKAVAASCATMRLRWLPTPKQIRLPAKHVSSPSIEKLSSNVLRQPGRSEVSSKLSSNKCCCHFASTLTGLCNSSQDITHIYAHMGPRRPLHEHKENMTPIQPLLLRQNTLSSTPVP